MDPGILPFFAKMDGDPSSQLDYPNTMEVTVCQWGECSATFASAQEVGQHVNEEHVGKKQSQYQCFWKNCLRNGEPLPNRFALIAHLRRHTGERPFQCPTCGKVFSRSDALNKHAKAQHGAELKNVSIYKTSTVDKSSAVKANIGQQSPHKLQAKLRRKLDYLESERSILIATYNISWLKIKRLRAEKLCLLELLLPLLNNSD